MVSQARASEKRFRGDAIEAVKGLNKRQKFNMREPPIRKKDDVIIFSQIIYGNKKYLL